MSEQIEMLLAPHYRGYAKLGTGQYLLNNSAAGEDPEFIISVATDAEKAGRVVGDSRANPPDGILQPDAMAVRIAFSSVAGLDAMESQLRKLRAEHYPETTPPVASDAQGWISVEERLPELDTPVWLHESDGSLWIGGRSDGGDGWLWCDCDGTQYQHDGKWFARDFNMDDDYQPTRWMSLPAAPATGAAK